MTETENLTVGKPPPSDLIVSPEQIKGMVRVVRGQRVMLDFDLARLYGVTTTRLNEQVARNRNRLPGDFAYQFTQQEVTALMSQNAISNAGRGGRRKRPWAFTEHGVAMLSSAHRPVARNPKHEIRNKSKTQNANDRNEEIISPRMGTPVPPSPPYVFPVLNISSFWIWSLFRISCFGFRI